MERKCIECGKELEDEDLDNLKRLKEKTGKAKLTPPDMCKICWNKPVREIKSKATLNFIGESIGAQQKPVKCHRYRQPGRTRTKIRLYVKK